MNGLVAAARSLGALLGEVADIDWRHPAWWGLVGGTVFLERVARAARAPDGELYALYLAANGGPRADTFMAWDEPPPETLALRVARAVRQARAGVETLAALDGSFPGQPLGATLAWKRGWLARAPLPSPSTVAFLTPRGPLLGSLDRSDEELARMLARALAGHDEPGLVPPADGAPTPAAVAVALADQPLDRARHLHRRAWTTIGGPWLGLGGAGPLALVTTCHLAVDGYGHCRIADEVRRRMSAIDPLPLARAAAGLGDAPPLPADGSYGEDPMGFAGVLLDGDPGFPALAYSFGRALDRSYREGEPDGLHRARRFSPSFQVPFAPGDRADPDRRARRVLSGLLAVRMQDGSCEPFADFRERVRSHMADEARGQGVLTRVLAATSRAPLPDGIKRRLLASRGEPHPLLPPVEVLGGRGCLSSIRFPRSEARPAAPLYAASSPALNASPHDGRGAVVLTLIDHGGAFSASVCGTGQASTHAGARRFLDLWLAELAAVR